MVLTGTKKKMPPKRSSAVRRVPERFIHPQLGVLDGEKFGDEFSLNSCPEVLYVQQYVECLVVYLRKNTDLQKFRKRNPQFFHPDVAEWLTVRVGKYQSSRQVEE
jgi:uncharacterized UBP type Zn finger protein